MRTKRYPVDALDAAEKRARSAARARVLSIRGAYDSPSWRAAIDAAAAMVDDEVAGREALREILR